MLASRGLLCRDDTGPNTGISNFVQFNRLHDNPDSAFQQESCQRTGAPFPLTPDPGPTPQGFLVKETAMLAMFPRLSRIPVLHGPVPEDKLDTIRDVVYPDD